MKKLLVLQFRENGISEKKFESLNFNYSKKILIKKGTKYFLKMSERRKIKVGLVGGVFDILHIGHVFTLNEAKKHCDVLVAVVASDEHILRKKRKLVHSQEYRIVMMDSLKSVDLAIAGGKRCKDVIEYIKPDVIIYGYDQEQFLKPAGVEIVQLKKYIEPKKFKSSKIIKNLGL